MSAEDVRKKLGATVELKTGFEDLGDLDLAVRGQVVQEQIQALQQEQNLLQQEFNKRVKAHREKTDKAKE